MNHLINLEKATCRSEKYKEGLCDLISDIQSKVNIRIMVEIGCYQGESTVIFAEKINNLETLFAVDPWINGYCLGDVCSDEYPMSVVENNFDLRIKPYTKIIKNKTTSENFSVNIQDHSLDFVYIDGDHSYESCKKDLDIWTPKIKKGGTIGGHDYLESCFPGVIKSVNDKFSSPDKIYCDTSWIKFL